MMIKNISINSNAKAIENIWDKRNDLLNSFLKDKLLIKTNQQIFILDTSRIIFIKALNNYSIIYLNNNQKITVSKTLKYYEDILQDSGFLRVSISYIVNLSCVNGIKKNGVYTLLLKNNIKIPISRSFKKKLFLNVI